MIDRVASWLRVAERVVVLTGAGVSAESGVPVFRGTGGLWPQFRPEQLATPEAFGGQPDLWFGEALDTVAIDRAIAAVEEAEVIVVVGTSSVVYPVATLPQMVRRRGATIVAVNVEETPWTGAADAALRGTAGDALPPLWGAA